MSDYKLSNDDPATAETFNPLFSDIDARIKNLEKAGSALNQAKDEIVQLGLERINPVVAKALESIENVSELADLFRAHSSSSVEIGLGVREFIISEDDRSLFAAPLYVAISVDGQLERWMAGQVQTWDKATGQIFVDVTHIRGEGVFDDWVVTPTHIPEQGPSIDAYTKSEVNNAIAQAKSEASSETKNELLGGVGAAFDTLKELSDAMGENVDAITALATTVGQKADSTQLLNLEATVNNLSLLPVGTTISWPTEIIPTGFLERDGSAISRSTYSALYAVIGTRYGPGDGSTTFNLPDDRGLFERGWDHGAGIDPDAASRTDRGDGTTGDNVGTLQTDEFKSHTHNAYQIVGAGGFAGGGNYNFHETNPTTAAGGNETRPVNRAYMQLIKY